MKLDYTFHSHTYRCGHATGDIEDYVLKAIEHGYRYYGVSDHVFLKGINSPTVRGDISCLDDYIAKFYESKSKHQNEIEMFLGFECEYSDYFADYYKYLLKERHFDYLICGQHYGYDDQGNEFPYFDVDEKSLYQYRDDLIKGMKSGLFMYIAHPDLYFICATEVGEIQKRIAKDIIDAAIKYDIVLELNIHGLLRRKFRKGRLVIDYPCKWFWKQVGKTNLKVVLGGDFHSPEEIGNMDTLKQIESIVKDYILKLADIKDVYDSYKIRLNSLL